MGMVERFNRTVRDKIERYLTAYDTLRWVDVLPTLVAGYNDSVHSSTGLKPNDVGAEQLREIQQGALDRIETVETDPLHVGSKVRRLRPRGLFDKRTGERWYKEVYEVTELHPFSYTIRAPGKDPLRRRFKHYELQAVDSVESHSMVRTRSRISRDLDELKKGLSVDRALRREGIDQNLVLSTTRRQEENRKLIKKKCVSVRSLMM
eukprot:Lithocolla_globosa_v1_NODE_115_length_6172_cov_14.462155.p3 type:complete len:206 gc:universal NODE_115_length_6172_cov_14.462155:2471-1854(-)